LVIVSIYRVKLLNLLVTELRRERLVYSQFKGVVEHARQQNFKELTGLLHAGICVYLNEPRFKFIVYHEIVAHYFKGVLLLVWVKLSVVYAFKRQFDYWNNFFLKNLVEVDVSPFFLGHLACLFETELVPFLQFSVVFIKLLNCVVGQMNKWLVDALLTEGKLVAACADVSLFEDVASDVAEIH
jgi:hypothetical protein